MISSQIPVLFQEYSKEKLLEITKVEGRGLVNEVYILQTATSKYVLRMDLDESSLDRFEKETWCAQQTTKINQSL